jgi:RNA polymerase sigma factor (sigma-70 family)
MSLSTSAPSRRPACAPLRGDEADLYRLHADHLWRVVRNNVAGPRERIDDACQSAWAIMLRTQPRRETVFAYLITVAIHEGWELSRRDRRQCPLLIEDDDVRGELHIEQTRGSGSPEAQVLARETLREIADALPSRQRTVVALLALGYSYREIGELLEYSYTTVNRQLVRAQRTLRPTRDADWR